MINTFFDNIDKALDIYCSYDKIVSAEDFNAQEGQRLLDTFLYQHELHSINKYESHMLRKTKQYE